jgi:predicted TIM-barrel fold metal-dependent hydrolase
MKAACAVFLGELAALCAELDVVDVHQHTGGWGPGPAFVPDQKAEAALRIEVIDSFGIDSVVLMPSAKVGPDPGDIRAANDAVAGHDLPAERVAARISTLSLDDPEAAVAELRQHDARGFRGIVFHHLFVAKPLDHPAMWPILEEAEARHFTVFLHVMSDLGLESLFRAERLAEAFPRVQFVLLGALMTGGGTQWATAVAQRWPNTWFDTAGMFSISRVVETFSSAVGHERLMFGTDLYVEPMMLQFPSPLYELLASPLELEVKRAIAGGNARRLLTGHP